MNLSRDRKERSDDSSSPSRTRPMPIWLLSALMAIPELGEWMFGGATRELLAASDVCCLMSH